MAQAHAWHPGSGYLNPGWQAPICLQPDELFSAWLVRAALNQGCDPLVLTGDLWPKLRAWTVDLDRGVSPDRLHPLSQVAGIPAAAFEASMLWPVASAISPDIRPESALWPWMLTLGSRNRKRHGGLQFCPHCLAEDQKPYYRLNWRFAWHTECVRHQCGLLDDCPACHAPVEPHRLTAMDGGMAVCFSCKADLRAATATQANEDALKLQVMSDAVIRDGHGYYGKTQLSVSEWFCQIRYFVGLIRRVVAVRPERLGLALKTLGVDAEQIPQQSIGLLLEASSVRNRELFLADAWRLVMAGPDAFLDAAKGASLGVQTLRISPQPFPVAFQQVIAGLPSNGRSLRKPGIAGPAKPKSSRTVMKMWLRLQRKAKMAER